MSSTPTTPCSVLFDTMKRQGGISYKNTAALILSGRPLSDGRSPASRVDDRTWVSRFVVHAPVGSLQENYFGDFTVSALRLISRLKTRNGKAMTSEKILALVSDEDGRAMDRALEACGQPASLYRNALERLKGEGSLTAEERAEVAMVLFVTVACTANARRAVARALEFTQKAHGGTFVTPATVPDGAAPQAPSTPRVSRLGLLPLTDGYVEGAPFWLAPTEAGTLLGSLALAAEAVTDVAADVSGEHARIWLDGGQWLIEGLDSRNGTVLVNGLTGEEAVVEPPRSERSGFSPQPVPLSAGDTLRLGSVTTFLVVEGKPIE